MTPLFHIAATAESATYHGHADPLTPHQALFVAFEAEDAADDDEAREAFTAALEVIQGGTWLILALDAGITDSEGTTKGKVADVVPATSAFATEPSNVIGWLEARWKTRPEEGRKDFWRAPKMEGEADMERLSARDLLRAAAAWPAPVPQRAGLVALVTYPTDFVPDQDKVAILWQGDPPTDATEFEWAATAEPGVVRVTHAGTDCAWRTEVLEAPPTLLAFLLPDGGVAQGSEDEALYRLTARIAEEGPSRLWCHPAVLALTEEPEAQPQPANAPRLLAQAAVVTLFDTILIGLHMPVTQRLEADNKETDLRLPRLLAMLGRALAQQAELDATARLYAEMHKAVRARIEELDEKKLIKLAQVSLNATGRHATLFDLLEKGFADNPPEPLRRMAALVGALATEVESEAGAEAFALALIRSAFEDGKSTLAEVAGVTEAQAQAGWDDFETTVRDGFNGAEALRRDSGGEIALALMRAAKASVDPPVAAAILAALNGADWPRFRLLGTHRVGPRALDTLAKAVVKMTTLGEASAADLKAIIETRAGAMHEEMVTGLLAGLGKAGVFRPDTAPLPLPLRLFPDLDPAVAAQVAQAISGFGVIVGSARNDKAPLDLCHVSLVEITPKYGTDKTPVTIVMPSFPALTDGGSEMFLPYGGFPLASPNLPVPRQDGGYEGAATPAEAEKCAYEVEDAVYQVNDKPPALAYGHHYGASGFWIANSGALPAEFRVALDRPFDPMVPPPADFGPTTRTPYLRRTAIAETTLHETGLKPRLLREAPAGVFPLVLDARRMTLARDADGETWVDLFRNPDDTGALGDDTPVTLAEVEAGWDGTREVTIEQRSVDAVLGTVPVPHDSANDALVIPGANVGPHWLRLRLGAPGWLAFAEPDPIGVSRRAPPAPIALVAQNKVGPGGTTWRAPFIEPIAAKARLPGVSFPDFEAWMANKKLAEAASDDPTTLMTVLRRMQAAAEAMGDPLVDRLNALPDPAAEAFGLTLAPLDGLLATGPKMPAFAQAELAPFRGLATLKAAFEATVGDGWKKMRESYLALLKEIDDKASVTLTVKAGTDRDEAKLSAEIAVQAFTVTVPLGLVARLRLEPLVAASHFEDGTGVMHPGLVQLATGLWNGRAHYAFGGAALNVEAMYPLVADSPPPAVQVRPDGAARSYRLSYAPLTDPAARPSWRQFAEVDVASQRWRPTGRPIYNWIDPAKPDAGPVVEVPRDRGADHRLAAFEEDAFLTREGDSGRTVRHRLAPWPAATDLGATAWPERSATYLRHAFELRGRYAGAVAQGPTTATFARLREGDLLGDPWDLSVAILADLSGELTRPQVRAILPLPRQVEPPEGEDRLTSQVPPLLCVLAEPPFGQLGLAERITAEPRVVPRFRLSNETDSLEVDLLRKEIGPDARLTYRGVGDDESREVTLAVEGPVGLQYEARDSAAPAYVNSQLLLRLERMTLPKGGIEEMAVGLRLRRHAAPGWSWAPRMQEVRATWTLLSGNHKWTLDEVAWTDDEEGPLLRLNGGVIEARRKALHPSGDMEMVPICAPDPTLGDVALARIDQGEGRQAFVVFQGRAADAAQGRSAADHCLASTTLAVAGALVPPAGLEERPALVTEATTVEWARSGRHADEFEARDDGEEAKRLDVTGLVAVADDGLIGWRDPGGKSWRRLRSPASIQPYPLAVHRHLGLVLRRPSAALGREHLVFHAAPLADSWARAKVSKPEGLHAAILEFETPARVLLATPNSLGEARFRDFETARFDLVGPLGAAPWSEIPQVLRLTLRLASRRAKASEKLTLTLVPEAAKPEEPETEAPTTEASKMKAAPLDLTLGKNADHVTVELVRNGTGTSWAWQAWADTADDTGADTKRKPVGGGTTGLTLDGGFEALALKVKAGSDDLWMDASLLLSRPRPEAEAKPQDYPEIDFDWFFPPDNAEVALVDAVGPDRLNRLREAQARIISISTTCAVRVT